MHSIYPVVKYHTDLNALKITISTETPCPGPPPHKSGSSSTTALLTSNSALRPPPSPKAPGRTSSVRTPPFLTQTAVQKKIGSKIKGEKVGKILDETKRVFKPEFLNRLNELVIFKSLGREDMKAIVELAGK